MSKNKNEIKEAAPQRFVIDDGSKRVPIINKFGDQIGEFYFTPADIGILERFRKLEQEAAEILNPFEKITEGSKMEDMADAMEAARVQLCDVLDKALGYEGAAARIFGRVHPFTPVGGRFYFEAIMEFIGNEINAAFDEQAAAFEAHTKKYTEAVK